MRFRRTLGRRVYSAPACLRYAWSLPVILAVAGREGAAVVHAEEPAPAACSGAEASSTPEWDQAYARAGMALA